MDSSLEMQHHASYFSISEIMAFMTHGSLHTYKVKGSNAPFEKRANEDSTNKGVVFVAPSKEALQMGKGYIVTSYETLREKNSSLTHWTPNTFRGGTYYDFSKRIIKGHERKNLKQINVMGFDIDTKDMDVYGLYVGCEEIGLPRPNLLLETPRGYQVFFVLDTPFYISNKQDYKSIKIAERVRENMRQALSSYVPLDAACIPFGFYRIPKEDNVVDFYSNPAKTKHLIDWSISYERKVKKSQLHVVYTNQKKLDTVSSEWYQAIIKATHISRGYHAASRNNALFTLAIANYVSDRSYEDTYNELDQFNSALDQPLSKQEFERTLKSAYSGKYKGPKRAYVENLLDLWTNGKVAFQGKEGWYKFKKPRESRTRSHYQEWEADIMEYINRQSDEHTPYLEGTLRTLAHTFGMAVSSLKEVLKRSDKIKKVTVGKGRGAVTKLTTAMRVFSWLLQIRKKNQQERQLTLAAFLPELNNTSAISLQTEGMLIDNSIYIRDVIETTLPRGRTG